MKRKNKIMNLLKTKINNKQFSKTEVIFLMLITLIIGLLIGGLFSKRITVTKQLDIKDKNLTEFIDNYEYILNNYYDNVSKKDLISNAIKGMMDSLEDPYSVYFDENETTNFTITLNGSYEGIGIQIIKNEDTNYMYIVSVFDNSAASKAGILVGDEIISINGKSVEEISVSDFSSMILKSSEKKFVFEIMRNNKKMDIELIKNKVVLPSVVSEIYEYENKKIGYIYISVFANNTYTQFLKELKSLEQEKIDSIIIDVRGNSGGHLVSVEKILSEFLNNKQIVYKLKQGSKITEVYGNNKKNKRYEICLLGDENSASASEVLIASLKENLNSIFIGKKTYGKGTVQELITLEDGTQYKITTKKWLTPLGNWINETEGIIPDIEVDLDSKYYETFKTADDTQLQKALEYLKNK